MDGLIPLFLRALKHKKGHKNFRSWSEGSTTTRSYHRLIGSDSVEGSSRGRTTRSEFQPPFGFMQQRSVVDLHTPNFKLAMYGLPAKQIGTSAIRKARK